MERIVVPVKDFDRYIAKIFAGQVLKKPDTCFCFATGGTTEPIFRELVNIKQALDIDFSQAKAVNVDEYAGVRKEDPESCYYRIYQDLYGPVGMGSFYVPVAPLEEAEEECARFGKVIESYGGIDLMLLSVGTNGHIAFNEPGTPWGRGIHVAELAESTFEAKKDLFGGKDKVPRYGITMGVSTLMRARRIIFIASGAHKKEIMKAVLDGPVTEQVPGSVLQLHPDVTVILDEAAM